MDPPIALPAPPPAVAAPCRPGPPVPGGGRALARRTRRRPAARAPAATVSQRRRPSRASRGTLFEGTFIDTVLTNRLDGTFPGPVNCLVSVPVYAADHLVIPAGARVLGEARAVNTFGQSRLAVTFHRVILPNGVHVDLDAFHGLNQVGDLGLLDQVDRHYAQIFGVSLALGAIAGFAQGQSSVGLDATAVDAYRQGTAASVSQSSARVLDRFLNLLPTVTIREGHRIKVYLSSDLELPGLSPGVPLDWRSSMIRRLGPGAVLLVALAVRRCPPSSLASSSTRRTSRTPSSNCSSSKSSTASSSRPTSRSAPSTSC